MKILSLLILLVLAGCLAVPAISFFYESGGGAACSRCHEMGHQYEQWLSSSHRNIPCTSCHGEALSGSFRFHLTNVLRVRDHLLGNVPEPLRLRTADFLEMQARCAGCHRQEFAQWSAGPHSVSYERLFLNAEHNRKEPPVDDCLRCHGMHFEGGIRDLLEPASARGPWRLRQEELAGQPAIPCTTCHSMHRPGRLLARWQTGSPPAARFQEPVRPSVGLFDRRSRQAVPVSLLPLPRMQDRNRPVAISPDPRQALCYQCHAPLAAGQVRSGDDRTPTGVHEGLSCFSCHDKHRQTTRASCATCHPRLSNCNRPVETMDTTFADPGSRNNIHFVKCQDCHPQGVPTPKKKES